jgi:hypothetical protein
MDHRTQSRPRWPRPLLALLLAASAAGCAKVTSSGYSASGDVTSKGKPLGYGTIEFVPEASGALRAGAEVRDGKYTLPNPPGLAPGRYKVRISSIKGSDPRGQAVPDAHLGNPDAKEQIPKKYNEETTLQAEVKPGESTTFNFELD